MSTKTFLKYRNAWLGIAMIWLVWYHSGLTPNFAPIRMLNMLGYGGVDICMFASGIGCYLSLGKDPDPSRFMQRRIARLFPTYLCFIAVWCVFQAITGGIPALAVLGNVLGVQNFTGLGKDFNWYISAIFLLYLLTPLFRSMADQTRSALGHAGMWALIVAFTLPFMGSESLIITASRFPIYYLGILFGRLCATREKLPARVVWGSIAACALGAAAVLVFFRKFSHLLWSHGLYWYPFALITPGLCILISLALERIRDLPGSGALLRVLEFVGGYSFELYLAHAFVFAVKKYIQLTLGLYTDSPYAWPLAFAAIAVGTAALHLGGKAIGKLFRPVTSKT